MRARVGSHVDLQAQEGAPPRPPEEGCGDWAGRPTGTPAGCLPGTACNAVLVATSAGFAGAGAVGLWHGEHGLAATAIVTALVSVNLWRNEIDPYDHSVLHNTRRHRADRLTARASFAVFTLHALAYVRDTWIMEVGWPCWVGVVGFYGMSQHLSKRREDRAWVAAHALFHVCVAVGQALVAVGVARARQPVPAWL